MSVVNDGFLAGRTALVTGAASGIGAACVDRLTLAGAQVYAVDRDKEGLQRFDGSASVVALTADLTQPGDIEGLPRDVDVLVNNAGVQHVSPIEDFPTEKWDLIIALMLSAPFRLVRQVLPHMYSGGWGRIVNISSVHGLRASPFKSAYVSAKHGLEGLSKVTALEAGPRGVTSNCVNPSYVRTPLVEKQITDQARSHGIPEAEVVEKVMLGPAAVKRLVEPTEVAELAAYLCRPEAASITGAAFTMDCGWTAH